MDSFEGQPIDRLKAGMLYKVANGSRVLFMFLSDGRRSLAVVADKMCGG